ncbi:hypothetical protein [Pedobacter africanus]|nr:hypothetical protein [Pedobacter africanus]
MKHNCNTDNVFKLCLALFAGFISFNNCLAQTNEINVSDTRSVNDLPGFLQRKVRFDFKERAVVSVPGSGEYSATMTIAPWENASGGKNHQLNFNDGGIFYRTGTHSSSSWEQWKKLLIEDTNGRIGIGTESPLAKIDVRGNILESEYGVINPVLNVFSSNTPAIGAGASISLGGKTNNATPEYAFAYLSGGKESDLANNYAGYFAIRTVSGGSNGEVQSANYERFRITSSGDVGIGTTDPKGYKLAVNGKVRAQEIKVEASPWPDYVFTKDYQLPSLQETEKHIKDKGHLPGIPSAAEVKANGIDLGEMNAKLLQKIEELTLHLIEKDKKDKEQQSTIEKLQEQVMMILKKVK